MILGVRGILLWWEWRMVFSLHQGALSNTSSSNAVSLNDPNLMGGGTHHIVDF